VNRELGRRLESMKENSIKETEKFSKLSLAYVELLNHFKLLAKKHGKQFDPHIRFNIDFFHFQGLLLSSGDFAQVGLYFNPYPISCMLDPFIPLPRKS